MSEQNNNLLTQFLDQDSFENLFNTSEEDNIKDTSELEKEEIEKTEEEKKEVEEEKITETTEEKTEENEIEFSFKTLASILADEGLVEFEDSENLQDSPEIIYESIKKSIDSGINSYKESIPNKAKEILEYLEQGGDIDKYLESLEKPFDINKLDLENESDQEKITREFYKLQNYDSEEIEEKIQDLKDSLLLEKESKLATKKVGKYFEDRSNALIQEQQALNDKAKKEYDDYINGLTSTINSSESLAGLSLTKDEKDNFKAYLLNVDKNGQTQYQREIAENPIQTQLELAYLKFKKFDYSNAIKAGETNAVKKWKSIIKSNETTVKGGKSYTDAKENSDFSAFKSGFLNNK